MQGAYHEIYLVKWRGTEVAAKTIRPSIASEPIMRCVSYLHLFTSLHLSCYLPTELHQVQPTTRNNNNDITCTSLMEISCKSDVVLLGSRF